MDAQAPALRHPFPLARILRFLCFLFFAIPAARGGEAQILSAPAEAGQYALWELDFAVPEEVAPFDPSEKRIDALILSPAGTELRVPAYWTQEYLLQQRAEQRKGVMVTLETPLPAPGSRPHWRIRFSPRTAGTHKVTLLLTKGEETMALWRGQFESRADPEARGFLHAPPAGEQYLRFDNGTAYFALGFNICWAASEEGTAGYIHYLDRLRDAGGNYTRLWLCTWGFSLETARPYAYDLGEAAQLDAVFRAAAERGIYIKLCIDNFYDFNNHAALGPYFAPAGPCRTKRDFFVLPEARRLHDAKLRYLVARYGAYANLYAWELWNEMNYALTDYELGAVRPAGRARRDHLVPWTLEKARALRALDPYGHPVTTSLGLHEVWKELWAAPEMDIVQQHSYIQYLSVVRNPLENDAALLARESRQSLAAFGKPTLLAEFGYLGSNEYNPLNDKDVDGLALHNAIWAGALCGHSGVPMLWWWDTYLEKRNLYYHYQALAGFLQPVDWSLPKEALSSDADPEVRVFVLRDARWAGLWLQNKAATWYDRFAAPRQSELRTLSNITVRLAGLPPGSYRVEWWETREGRVLAAGEVESPDGRLSLLAPAFRQDVAARLFLQEAAPDR